VIAALRDKPLQGAVVGVQLYAEPIADLMEFIEKSGALARCVRPYVYAAAADRKTVAELIGRVAQGEVDVIVFTSSPQVDRFYEVIESEGLANGWREGSKRVRLAAVGPVVAEALRVRGNTVAICPDQGWVMKNLVQHIRREMGAGEQGRVTSDQ
jgi:uroporphyrinogen-III synthase